MAQTLIFLPWQRSGIYDLANPAPGPVARLSGNISLQVTTLDETDSRSANLPFEIMGPGDVSGITINAIKHKVPPSNTLNAEANKFVHVELAEPDIPWRYTPQLKSGAGDSILRPWITLLVGTPDEIELLKENKISLSPAILQQHPLAQAASYAHVQLDLDEEIEDPAALNEAELNNLIDNYQGRSISRLLSWRRLQAHQKYIAAIVPTFQENGQYSWTGTESAPIIVQGYHIWNFNTGEAGDFRTLAAKLRALTTDKEFGLAPLEYNRLDPKVDMEVRGALAPVGGKDEAIPDDVKNDLKKLTVPPIDERGRPVLSLPLYGEAWTDENIDDVKWGEQVNYDPRHRGVAGLGVAGGIYLQETIVDAVKTQVGAIQTTKQRINQLVLGVQAASTLWQNRLPKDAMQRLMLFGPVLARMATSKGKALDVVAGAGRALPKAIFSTAAARVLRGGTARSRHNNNLTGKVDVLLPKLNTCPVAPAKDQEGLPSISDFAETTNHADLENTLSSGSIRPNHQLLDAVINKANSVNDAELTNAVVGFANKIKTNNILAYNPLCLFVRLMFWIAGIIKNLTLINMCALCNYVPPICNFFTAIANRCDELRNVPYVVLIQILILLDHPVNNKQEILQLIEDGQQSTNDGDSLVGLGESIITQADPIPCTTVDLQKFNRLLTDLISPIGSKAWIKTRVVSTLEGYESEKLEPVEICTSIDLPTWRFLRDKSPNWLLPGVGQLKLDAVYAFESNPMFVDAFKLGINTQTLAELRWRNMPIISRCTPLRMFWGRTNKEHTQRIDDINGIHGWGIDTPLGDEGHLLADSGKHLVLVLRTDIFRRYPNTLVSAIKAKLDDEGKADFSEEAEPQGDEDRLWPIFQGNVTEDVNFFGFPLTPEEGRDYWMVIEESPPGYRFRSDLDIPIPFDGANFANTHFNDPTRVVIRGDELILENA